MSWEEKKMYMVSLVEKAEVAQRKTDGPSQRGFSFRYHLWKNNTRVEVCKNMISSTLGISEKTFIIGSPGQPVAYQKVNLAQAIQKAI